MLNLRILLFLLTIGLVGCAPNPKNAFLLSPTTLQDRQTQTRAFETRDETALLVAGIGVLQDMGYSIDETEKDLGLVAASKTVDATDQGQILTAVVIALLGGGNMSVDNIQRIKVSLITSPSRLVENRFLARVSFQRIIWNTQGQVTRAETIKDKKIYAEFFDKLEKSVFLEAHKI